jgi:hypothetical protein
MLLVTQSQKGPGVNQGLLPFILLLTTPKTPMQITLWGDISVHQNGGMSGADFTFSGQILIFNPWRYGSMLCSVLKCYHLWLNTTSRAQGRGSIIVLLENNYNSKLFLFFLMFSPLIHLFSELTTYKENGKLGSTESLYTLVTFHSLSPHPHHKLYLPVHHHARGKLPAHSTPWKICTTDWT